jgi:hypothetical protein
VAVHLAARWAHAGPPARKSYPTNCTKDFSLADEMEKIAVCIHVLRSIIMSRNTCSCI